MNKIEEIWMRYSRQNMVIAKNGVVQRKPLVILEEDFLKAADEIECYVLNQANQNFLNNRLQRDTDIQIAILNNGISYLGLPRNIRDEDA